MSRSSKKSAFIDASLLKKVEKMQSSAKKVPIKTWSRRSTIYPSFVGLGRLLIVAALSLHLISTAFTFDPPLESKVIFITFSSSLTSSHLAFKV